MPHRKSVASVSLSFIMSCDLEGLNLMRIFML